MMNNRFSRVEKRDITGELRQDYFNAENILEEVRVFMGGVKDIVGGFSRPGSARIDSWYDYSDGEGFNALLGNLNGAATDAESLAAALYAMMQKVMDFEEYMDSMSME